MREVVLAVVWRCVYRGVKWCEVGEAVVLNGLSPGKFVSCIGIHGPYLFLEFYHGQQRVAWWCASSLLQKSKCLFTWRRVMAVLIRPKCAVCHWLLNEHCFLLPSPSTQSCVKARGQPSLIRVEKYPYIYICPHLLNLSIFPLLGDCMLRFGAHYGSGDWPDKVSRVEKQCSGRIYVTNSLVKKRVYLKGENIMVKTFTQSFLDMLNWRINSWNLYLPLHSQCT